MCARVRVVAKQQGGRHCARGGGSSDPHALQARGVVYSQGTRDMKETHAGVREKQRGGMGRERKAEAQRRRGIAKVTVTLKERK